MMKNKPAHVIFFLILLALFSTLLCAADQMYWDGSFDPINLDNINTKSSVSQASSSITLITTGNAQISADNTDTAQLSCATDTLVTTYKITFDGDGSSDTGGSNVDYADYDTFLTGPAEGDVTYVADDNDVVVTLFARAENDSLDVADAGDYSATQTLTVQWVGP